MDGAGEGDARPAGADDRRTGRVIGHDHEPVIIIVIVIIIIVVVVIIGHDHEPAILQVRDEIVQGVRL